MAMKQLIIVIFLSPVFLLLGCTDSKEVQMVKEGRLAACPGKSVDEMVSSYMGSPSWDSGTAEDGTKFVNIGGDITFHDKPVRALLQFQVDPAAGTFEFGALEFNEVPQINILAMGLLSNMCGESVAENAEYGVDIRAEIMEALDSAAVAKVVVSEYFWDYGTLPKNIYEAGLLSPDEMPSDYGYGFDIDDGEISIPFDNSAYNEIRGKVILLTPDTSSGSSVDWSCSAPDIADAYLPQACR